jgi:hypothetical protein
VNADITYEPVQVHVVADSTRSQPAAPARRIVTRYGTETVDNTNPVRPLLPESAERIVAHIQATGGDIYLCESENKASQALLNVSVPYPKGVINTYNSQAGPGASVGLAGFSGGNALVPGRYKIEARAYFGPAVAPVDGTDSDNLALDVDGVSIGSHLMIPATENLVQAWDFGVIETSTGAVQFKTIGAATAGVVYRTSISAFPLNDAGGSPGTFLREGNAVPWPVRTQRAVWIAQAAPNTVCSVSFTADYEVAEG